MATAPHHPNPERIFEAFNAYQRTFALKGAVELEIFTHIADGATSASDLASRSHANPRAMRILCDFLTIHGFLTKNGSEYGLTEDSAFFLSKRSPAYLGSAANFLTTASHVENYRDIAAVVRKGGTLHGHGNMEPNNPIWVEFARSMVPMIMPVAQAMAGIVNRPGAAKVLDIAAGHGMYGISIARLNTAAQIVAVDWPNVLEVARENAASAGVIDRYKTVPGSAFEVDFGSGFDTVLLPAFLHHFDPPTNVKLLKKIHGALKPGGMVVTAEFIPNEDRITPPVAAAFSMMMLASTEGGDAYTFTELDRMFREAGFGESALRELDGLPQSLVLTARP